MYLYNQQLTSIMEYNFAAFLTVQNIEVKRNSVLSEMDKAFVTSK